MFLSHRDDEINQRWRNLKCIRADLRDREPICEGGMHLDLRWFACFKRGGKARHVLCFNGHDFRVRQQSFDGQRNSGEQTGTTDRNDQRVEVGNLLDNFESHRSLAGNDRGIIVPIDVGEAFFFCELECARFRFSEICSMKNDVSTKLLAGAHLY